MAIVSVATVVNANKKFLTTNSTTSKRFALVSGSTVLNVPYAPSQISYSGFGISWTEQQRDGVRKPLLIPSAAKLKKMNFSLQVTNNNHQKSVESWLKTLESISRSGNIVKVRYGSWFDTGPSWKITNVSIDSVVRHPTNSGILEANVSVELTEYIAASSSTVTKKTAPKGPTSGGVKPTTAAKKPVTGGVAKGGVVRTYTVKKGDTLSGIAIKYYKNASLWRKIATANGIKNPLTLQIGKKLRIP